MGAASSLKRLPTELRTAVDGALQRGCTIDDVVALLDAQGHDVSRSSVGRYRKKLAAEMETVTAEARRIRALVEAYGDAGGRDDDKSSARLVVQLAKSAVARGLLDVMADEDAEISPLDATRWSGAARSLSAAEKTELDRRIKQREDEAAQAVRKDAADVAVTAGRKAGATEQTLATIRSAIMGLA